METKTEYKADAVTQSDLDEGLALLRGEPDTPPTKEEADTMFMLFLKWEHATRDTIDFKKIYVDMADDLVAGLLLSQLVFWYLLPSDDGNSKLRVYRNGYWWIAKQRDDWYNEIRISTRQYDRAVSILEERGLVHTDNFRFDGMRTAHIRLDEPAFMQAWQREIKRQNVAVLHKSKDRSYTNVNSGLTQSVRPLTETTTETTAESTEEESRASAATLPLPPLPIEDSYTRTYYVKDKDLVTVIGKAATGPWRVVCDACGNGVTLKAIGEIVACRCGMHEFVLTDARPEPAKDGAAVLADPQVKRTRAAPVPPPPAVQAYHRATGKFPNKALWPGIVQVIGANPENVARFEKVCLAYIACGWNPGNVKGMLSFYQKGEIPGDGHKAGGRIAENGHGRRILTDEHYIGSGNFDTPTT